MFTLAGDFVLSGLLPASAPQQAVMLDHAPAAVHATAVVQEVEEEAMAEMAVSESIPSTMPQMGDPTAEPALGEAEQPQLEAGLESANEGQAALAATAAPAEEQAQAMAVEPPKEGDSEVMAEMEAVEAPATLSPEATGMTGAGAARAGKPATSTTVATPPLTKPPPVSAPTTMAQAPAPAPMIPEAQEGKTLGPLWQPFASPLRLLEITLALLVILLGSVAIIATILQRRLG
jgi:cyclophilin family peptidyl-prolyl cis-trans isomerase